MGEEEVRMCPEGGTIHPSQVSTASAYVEYIGGVSRGRSQVVCLPAYTLQYVYFGRNLVHNVVLLIHIIVMDVMESAVKKAAVKKTGPATLTMFYISDMFLFIQFICLRFQHAAPSPT